MSKGRPMKDLSNKKFGHLTVLEPTKERQNRYIVWLCKCDCGNLTKANSWNLQAGQRTSCGCARQAVKDNWPQKLKELRKEQKWNSKQPKKKRQYKKVEGVDV